MSGSVRTPRSGAKILRVQPPSRMLEIGSYEGRCACFLIDECAKDRPIELHCIDTWAGGVDNDASAMPQVERRFDANISPRPAPPPPIPWTSTSTRRSPTLP